ncbi:tryptophan-rich sensory protein [Paenibacillus glycanilyticus]|uniref:Tryptophan-rich sensory protein n=1 Tax=Paenibacillus glycanilyticus TaxID=126569 RepID=A0ABQ6NP65_9BACL|nr:tryptophan-rich sensory protein [Paenibacillus glycanilyticus]GMK46871.1 tryptophan-rich sensory protein [Paenibacillus glycanilyticus]
MKFILRWLNAAGLVLVLIMNYLAETIPIGGQTTGEIAARYPVLIQPAGYAFGIWTVIYALLIGFVWLSFTAKGKASSAINAIGIYFFLSCLFNAAWLVLWHLEKLASSVTIMFALLLALILIYTGVRQKTIRSLTRAERLWVLLPFSLYLGWICVASIVNVSVALYASDWNRLGLSEEAWTVIMLLVAALLCKWVGGKYRDGAFMAVFVWAFVAIGVNNGGKHPVIAWTAYSLATLLAVLAVYTLFRGRRKRL